MSFAAQTKKELTLIEALPCCEKSELAALIRMNGTLKLSQQTLQLEISTENAAIARRIYSLIRKHFETTIELFVRKKMRLKKNNVYIVRLLTEIRPLLKELHIMYEGFQFNHHIFSPLTRKTCCKKAYLRGAFLASGSVNNPEGASYHLEISCMYSKNCDSLVELANFFQLNARRIERKKGYILYLKEGEKIIELLSLIGAHQALFKFEDVRIMRDMRNSVNRIVNCETANLNKTISAAMRQIENIKLIKERKGFEQLPEKLREIAILRLEHPEITLKELGDMLPGKVSKSGVNHRLRKLDEIAQQLRRI